MKCAFGGEADIPAMRFFVVQGQQAQSDRLTSMPPGSASFPKSY
jgi:hypothetical protein